MRSAYGRAATLTGDLTDHETVQYVRTLKKGDRIALNIWGGLLTVSSIALIAWIMYGTTPSLVGVVIVVLMILIELVRIAQTATLWVFAHMAHDPIPMKPLHGLRVAVHTTIVPGKEPFDLVSETLLAMKAIRYDGGTIDVWLLDEGNDPSIKAWCESNGVFHFSRKGQEKWNTDKGKFKKKTKHGNLNSFHDAHAHKYDIVAQMDPDHIPNPQFVERTLGYFADPNVGFVVAPQVYGNIKESFIARASAFQAYVFHGIIQRGGNGLRAPLLIGTNHLVRVEALRDVDGYADNIIEDHLTSMAMFAKKNIRNVYWKGVYTPDILSIGEGPTSFTDYFNQQKRWAYGIWVIAGFHSPRMFGGMRPAQRAAFTMLQLFYPSVAISWVLSVVLSTLFVTNLVQGRSTNEWLLFWGISMFSGLGFFFWLRKFNLVRHERTDWGFAGMTLLLMCIPVYVGAGFQALLRKPLTYAVTAKGDLASPDNLRTFVPHLVWTAVIASILAFSLVVSGASSIGTQLWLGWMIVVCMSAVAVHTVVTLVARREAFLVSRVFDLEDHNDPLEELFGSLRLPEEVEAV
jgi:cellulose synthase (UDP-forming)